MTATRASTWVITLALAAGSAFAQQKAQPRPVRPAPWFLSVSHRIELGSYLNQKRQLSPDASIGVLGSAPRHVINLTAGILVDDKGHVLTRLVNLDHGSGKSNVSVTTNEGRILPATLIGLDGPTGFAVLDVPGLKGVAPAPPPPGRPSVIPDSTFLLTPEFRMRRVSDPIERVAMSPEVKPQPARILQVQTSPSLSRAGVAFLVESPGLMSSGDLSIVQFVPEYVYGVAKYVAPGHGHVYPVEYLRDVVTPRVVKNNGSVRSGWLGLEGRSLSDAASMKLPEGVNAGVVVETVLPRSPAAEAGLMISDLVVKLDDIAIRSSFDLMTAVGASPAGTPVQLTVIRDGKPLLLNTVLGARMQSAPYFPGAALGPPDPLQTLERNISEVERQIERAQTEAERNSLAESLARLRAAYDKAATAPAVQPGRPDIDVTVLDLTEQLAGYFGVDGGVLVENVQKGSAAEKAGLKAGDVVTAVAGIPVRDRRGFESAVAQAARSGRVEVTVQRERSPVTVVVIP
jgi:serine protease Do